MKNSIHYSKQNTAKAIRVIAALASLGQQTSHSLQSLCFAPCNVIYYFIATVLRIWFSVPVKWDESAVCNPTFKVSPLGLKIAVSSRFTGTENRIFKRGAMKSIFTVNFAKNMGKNTLSKDYFIDNQIWWVINEFYLQYNLFFH